MVYYSLLYYIIMFMVYNIVLYYGLLYFIILWYLVLYYMLLYSLQYIILRCIISWHIILCYIILWYLFIAFVLFNKHYIAFLGWIQRFVTISENEACKIFWSIHRHKRYVWSQPSKPVSTSLMPQNFNVLCPLKIFKNIFCNYISIIWSSLDS